MACTLEIAVVKTIAGPMQLRSATIGEATRAHCEPVLRALGLDPAAITGDWTGLDRDRFTAIDIETLAIVEDLPSQAISELQALVGFADDDGAQVNVFVRFV